jgi:hypothetical protein
MKWFAILLLVGNVALAGWQFNEHVRENAIAAAGTPPLPPRTPSLRLISELAELPERRADATGVNAGADDDSEPVVQAVDLSTELNSFGNPSDNCISVGPITDEVQLNKFRIWLRLRATVVHTRVETVRQRRFFWVYLEPASNEEAKKNLSDLERRGVTDYMLIRRGGLKNAISLGLFRSQDSVNRRLAEMNRQGYKPVVVPKFKTTENYWLRATMAEGFEDTSIIPPDLIGDATLEPIDCAGIVDAAFSDPQ